MKKRGFTARVGPLGMSLAAAALTAVAFAAVSLADNGGGKGSGSGSGEDAVFLHQRLSEADRQKMEEFRRCIEDNGAPAPPDPGKFDSGNPPKPPSAADREKLEQAFETCKDELPEDLRKAGPPHLRFGGCAPPPGAPGTEERGDRENQSGESGASSSGGTT